MEWVCGKQSVKPTHTIFTVFDTFFMTKCPHKSCYFWFVTFRKVYVNFYYYLYFIIMFLFISGKHIAWMYSVQHNMFPITSIFNRLEIGIKFFCYFCIKFHLYLEGKHFAGMFSLYNILHNMFSITLICNGWEILINFVIFF